MEKFGVGDKVRIVRMDTKWSAYQKWLNKYIGVVGTIIEKRSVVTDDDPYEDVRLPDGRYLSFKTDWLELVEKKKKGWTGKVVCVESDPPNGLLFTIGKIYDVVDGKLKTNFLGGIGTVTHGDWFFESPEDIDRRVLHYGFTEFKDMARDLKCKVDKHWNGKMLCTSSYGRFYTKGKVYDVIDGLMIDDTGTRYNMSGYSDGYSNPEEIIDSAHKDGIYEFVEFKGFAGK